MQAAQHGCRLGRVLIWQPQANGRQVLTWKLTALRCVIADGIVPFFIGLGEIATSAFSPLREARHWLGLAPSIRMRPRASNASRNRCDLGSRGAVRIDSGSTVNGRVYWARRRLAQFPRAAAQDRPQRWRHRNDLIGSAARSVIRHWLTGGNTSSF